MGAPLDDIAGLMVTGRTLVVVRGGRREPVAGIRIEHRADGTTLLECAALWGRYARRLSAREARALARALRHPGTRP